MAASSGKGKRRGPSAQQMIEAGGFWNFVRAIRFASRYGALCKQEGDLLTMREYAAKAGLSNTHAFREQQAWRACVGRELTVLDVLSEEVLAKHGYTETQRQEAIARELAGRDG